MRYKNQVGFTSRDGDSRFKKLCENKVWEKVPMQRDKEA